MLKYIDEIKNIENEKKRFLNYNEIFKIYVTIVFIFNINFNVLL